ncbi:hypothetical protein Kpol_529p7 [Vanderwaltozyma polyspora DSM 70294]|uniref:Glucosidase 2 subunit beta n=1 Tax=Vanderwaltozyma polyspora (strain ATCC 22028 / DSM 70294 / BCRC 21397 / CBS 2163 / NBRC 10782 / NRRL Y-8283 / UCD 57-17) TaxID=436907 RepID=A7TM60_VANPO|nr:uncharacterized protein Kpol_529p7 [Vanderwaltozyma polyspora DSM 70294]EDO16627.1 hypothetical protein Kpol_529p7 [Vanderwaltozyma polyspora DSM 70294]
MILPKLVSFISFAFISSQIVSGKPIIGVPEDQLHLYQPITEGKDIGKWRCIGAPTVLLNYNQINDGICDCPDGSDEPGTNACENRLLFYCKNKGFLPRYISTNKVSDGICDCCDCSDESFVMEPPAYKGSDCLTLQNVYNHLIEEETNIFAEGAKALEDLKVKHSIRSIEDELANGQKEMETLNVTVNNLRNQLSDYESLLVQERTKYEEDLKKNNPILYEFEKMDMTYLSQVVNSTFEEVGKISNAYHEIIKIMDKLSSSYTPSLKDRVVNENVANFAKLYKESLEKIKTDPNIDTGLKGQLADYFLVELPKLFTDGKSDDTARYVLAKITFVRALALGKVDYSVEIVNAIDKIREMLNDISENYNVNFQDKGVIAAVNSYKDYLGKYESSLKTLVLPENFIKEIDELYKFVEENIPKLTTSQVEHGAEGETENEESNEMMGLSWGGIMNKIGGLLPRDYQSSFGSTILSLKNQISTHENEALKLKERIKGIEEQMKDKEELFNKFDDLNDEDKVLLEIKELIEKMKDFSITDKIDNYSYEISLNPKEMGSILQKETKGNQKTVSLGELQTIKMDKTFSLIKFVEYLKLKYTDEDIMLHLINENGKIGEEIYLFDNLQDINNGLIFEYENGDKCWNGPHRSARVYMRCGNTFKIHGVQETTKCNYIIDASGPLGCNSTFAYNKDIQRQI